MRALFRIAAAAALVLLAGGWKTPPLQHAPKYEGDQRPQRKIFIGLSLRLTLPPKDSADLEIVLDPQAYPITRDAANELQEYLQKRLQTRIPIVTIPSENKISFFVGISRYSRQAKIDDASLCRDAFIIRRIGRKIYIVGRDDPKASLKVNAGNAAGINDQFYERATLFGVYDFLERFASVRFYWPDELGIVVPSGTAMEIPEVDIYDRPDFECRYYSVYAGQGKNEEPVKSNFDVRRGHARIMQSHYNRLLTFWVPCSHGVTLLKLPERFGKTHPEYFALRKDGTRNTEHLCLSSGVVDQIGRDAEAILQGKLPVGIDRWFPWKTQLDFFDHHYEDGYFFCTCEECQKHYSKGARGTTDFVWSTVVKNANALKRKGIHGYLTMMAYAPYNEVPDIDIPDNVLVMVATIGPWGDAARNALIRKWARKLNRKVWLWNYSNKLTTLDLKGIPCSTPRRTGEFYKEQAPYIYGAFNQTQVDKSIYNYLNYYVFGKVCWNNQTDVDALLEEHHKVMFGSAAVPMGDIFRILEEKWLQVTNKTVDTPIGPQAVPIGDYELWNTIYSPAVLKRLEDDFHQALELSKNSPAITARIQFLKKEFLEPLKTAEAAYCKDNNRIQGFAVPLAVAEQPLKKTGEKFLDPDVWKQGRTLYLHPWQIREGAHFKTLRDTGLSQKMKILLDPENLYLRFDLDESQWEKVKAVGRNHDDLNLWLDNGVEIFLNPEGNRQGYYHLIINSKGSVYDVKHVVRGPKLEKDISWSSGASARVTPGQGRWVMEVTLPRQNLAAFGKDGFTANFACHRVTSDEESLFSWSPFMKNSFHDPDAFGMLRFHSPKNLVKDGNFCLPLGKNHRNKAWACLWQLPEGVGIEQDRNCFIFGGQSLKFSYTGSKLVKQFHASQSLTLEPDTRYRISYYLKLQDVIPVTLHKRCGVTVQLYGPGYSVMFPRGAWTGSTDWLYETYEFKTGPAAPSGQSRNSDLLLWFTGCSGTVWFDGIRLYKVEE